MFRWTFNMDLSRFVLFVILISGVVHLSDSFNIDIKTAHVFSGEPGTAFGYTAEFIDDEDMFGQVTTSLLVGAPRKKVTNQSFSGIYYDCDMNTLDTKCQLKSVPPQVSSSSDNMFSEQHELFGLALTLANNNTAVICGHLWTDLRWAVARDLQFPIGRCRILPSPAGFPGLTAYRDHSKYIALIELDGERSSQPYFGRAEFGFSADGDGKGNVVIGAPGYSISRGGVTVFNVVTQIYDRLITVLDSERESFLGYAVAVGNFCGPRRFCFATSNRQMYGKVHLLEHKMGADFEPLLSKKGEQEYSSFGSALCAMDVNGDGWADLLVGAPTYTMYANDSSDYDVGRVFVFISRGEIIAGQDNFINGVPLSGDDISFSRFGSAIGNIGDINRDSINDIAVGAPLEQDGTGALYIYLGAPDGPANKYSQKIMGQDFPQPLRSFGTHISKPTSALSDYDYPDFAVGAPESAAVVYLKTRLIINAEVSISVTPNPVDKINDLCPQTLSGRESGCVDINLCITFSYKGTSRLRGQATSFESLDFDIDFDVDKLISKDGSRRVGLYDETHGSTFTSISQTVKVPRQTGLCLSYTGVLKQEQIDRNPFVPVQLYTSFRLNTTFFSDIAPMLNQSMPNTATEQVKFKSKCGADEKCHTDLVLTGHVQYVPTSVSAYPFNVVNETKQVELVLDLLNTRETSFGIRLTVNITGRIEFWTATGNTTIVCDDMVDHSLLNCRGWAPLGENEAVRIRLKFLAESVPLEPESSEIRFQVTAMPFDPTENPETKPNDNTLVLSSRTVVVADVRLDGSSNPSVQHVADSDQADITLTHKLLVTNRGPSFLPDTHLNVTLPVRDSTGNELLQNATVTLKQEGGMTVVCPELLYKGSVIGGTTTTTTTDSYFTTTTPSSGGNGGGGGGGGGGSGSGGKTTPSSAGGSSTTEDPFGGGIRPSKRRRKRESSQAQNAPPRDNSRSMPVDCTKYECRIYRCQLTALPAKQSAEVNVAVTVRRSAIIFPGNIDTLLYTTTTTVAEPTLALFYPWSKRRIEQVETSIRRLHSVDEINIWYIIGGVIGGILLLIIVAIVAWRLGFFNRKNKAKLEKLKRQSGFYEGKRSMKRDTKPAPSSGDAPGNE